VAVSVLDPIESAAGLEQNVGAVMKEIIRSQFNPSKTIPQLIRDRELWRTVISLAFLLVGCS
jgi:hypothetical protein